MKCLLLLLSTVLFTIDYSFSQDNDSTSVVPVDKTTGLITYQEVVEVKGTKQDLFNRCVDWVNNFYANPVSVTQIRDPKTGKIEGGHQFRIHNIEDGYEMGAGMILYKFIVEFKDGRYRYTITDFVLRQPSRYPVENWLDDSDPAYNKQWNEYLKQMDEFVKNLIDNLKEKMKPAPEAVEEEW